ncbi:hypothetical protein ONS95_007429 [Cadophora gregata]|uniref:uncharacterized protein n=1 Tax=Cadophora gregata TaxID=51156 RepID=UPI0026DCE4F5|nr:uncharacterized protein ONS95_007429 [Cadophora gregata]KAK0118541.1 hypothetical protein ONS96_011635 [Cadophora gregata f. sp. sojae]KAK0125797.1 hypothetical protein ONS95_007429 [Cadophora gregata]
MPVSDNQAFSVTPAMEKKIDEQEVNAMMGFNRVDLGKDGLARSIYATPGMIVGTKREILEEQEKKKRQDAVMKREDTFKKAKEAKEDGAKAGDGMEVDSAVPNWTS